MLLIIFKSDAGWEEYVEYVFPDDSAAQPMLKLLSKAKKWKEDMENAQQQRAAASAATAAGGGVVNSVH